MNYGYGPPSMRQEVPLFSAGGVQVTSARFICWQQTYPVANITAVTSVPIHADRGAYKTAFGLGLLLVVLLGMGGCGALMDSTGFAVTAFVVAGLVFAGIVIAMVMGSQAKPSFGVMITTSGGNVRAIVSPDAAFVQAVIAALNQALAMR